MSTSFPTTTEAGTGDAACRPEEVLVAIPTLNEASAIAGCISSLIGEDPFMERVRIVVADGGSTDRTTAIVDELATRHPDLRRIDNPDRLQSAAVNRVVEQMAEPGHRYLVRCDAHATYPPGYVRAVAASLAARPDAAAVATPMDATGTGCFQRAAAWAVDTKLGSGGSAHRGGRRSHWVDHGHHAGFRLDWFRRIEGYDETFSHNEDAEFDHRLGLAGGRIWLDADIRLDYHMRPSLGALARQYWRYGRGRARTVFKHRMRPRLRQMIPVAVVLVLTASLLAGFALPLLWVPAAAYTALLAGASLAGMAALRGPCGLWAGPALGAMHVSWGAGFLWQALTSGAAGAKR